MGQLYSGMAEQLGGAEAVALFLCGYHRGRPQGGVRGDMRQADALLSQAVADSSRRDATPGGQGGSIRMFFDPRTGNLTHPQYPS